jgi:hypothetical protein
MFSCSKKEENGFDLDLGLEISVVDKAGNDLLNPVSPNSFKESEIKIYYLLDGKKVEVFYSNYDHPRNFYIYQRGNEFRIAVILNDPITYIQWNNSDTDTIQCEVSRAEGSVVCRKVWFNGELRWDNYSTERFIKIVK